VAGFFIARAADLGNAPQTFDTVRLVPHVVIDRPQPSSLTVWSLPGHGRRPALSRVEPACIPKGRRCDATASSMEDLATIAGHGEQLRHLARGYPATPACRSKADEKTWARGQLLAALKILQSAGTRARRHDPAPGASAVMGQSSFCRRTVDYAVDEYDGDGPAATSGAAARRSHSTPPISRPLARVRGDPGAWKCAWRLRLRRADRLCIPFAG
jgi:hypothetical protein